MEKERVNAPETKPAGFFDWLLLGVGLLLLVASFFPAGTEIRSLIDPWIMPYADEIILSLVTGGILLVLVSLAVGGRRHSDDFEKADLRFKHPLPDWSQPVAMTIAGFIARSLYAICILVLIGIVYVPFSLLGIPQGLTVDAKLFMAAILLIALAVTQMRRMPRLEKTYITVGRTGLIVLMGLKKNDKLKPEEQEQVIRFLGPELAQTDWWKKIDAIIFLIGFALVYLSFQTPQNDLSKFIQFTLIGSGGMMFASFVFVEVIRKINQALGSLLTDASPLQPYIISDEDSLQIRFLGFMAFVWASWIFILAVALNATSQAYASVPLSLGIWLAISRVAPARMAYATSAFGKALVGFGRKNKTA